ncbi:ROK family transcriptional regulator [Sutcliffiella cohnii]
MKMIQTYNQHVVKLRNKSLVLQTIMEAYPISRADLASKTGLNKGTVSSLVNDLLDEKLLIESGPGVSSGGRRPVILHFNKKAGFSISIDIGVNYILGILTDLEGAICTEKHKKINDLSFEEMLVQIYLMIDELLQSLPPSPYGIVGIGIGVPGTVDNDGKVLLAPNLGWRNINLKQIISDKYHVPVTVINEANAGAYGEKKFGVGQEFNNIIYISGGIGIGVGLILHGNLYKGQNGLSGELGHMTINFNGPVCKCGNIGCWELYASEKALLEMARENNIQSEDLNLESLVSMAEDGETEAILVINQLADRLAIGINNIINTFNPEQIIIGNRLAVLEKWLVDPLTKQVGKHALATHRKDFQLQFSTLEKRSAALGVAAFVNEHFLAIEVNES